MVYRFYTTYISVDLAQNEVFRANVGKGGIKPARRWYMIVLKNLTFRLL